VFTRHHCVDSYQKQFTLCQLFLHSVMSDGKGGLFRHRRRSSSDHPKCIRSGGRREVFRVLPLIAAIRPETDLSRWLAYQVSYVPAQISFICWFRRMLRFGKARPFQQGRCSQEEVETRHKMPTFSTFSLVPALRCSDVRRKKCA